MDLTQAIFRYALLPAHERVLKRRRTFQILRGLEKSQWLSPEVLAQQQLDALRNLVAHADANCPYYHRVWRDHGLAPRGLHDHADFHRWPTIDRQAISDNRLEMRSRLHRDRLIHSSTGGSTGTPLRFDYDLSSYEFRNAAWHRGYGWAGAGPGTRQFYLWGVAAEPTSFWRRRKEDLYNRLYRRRIFNSFDLSDESLPEVARQLQRTRPQAIVAYTGPLFMVAREFSRRGIQPYSPSAIVVGAEKLHDFQRTVIEHVFQAPVFETYGTREFMLIGAECDRHDGLHQSMEHLLIEVLNDDGTPTRDGDEGNIVVTDLYNYGMPFIRYVTGDRAIAGWKICSCGRGLPMIAKITGRRLDMLRMKNGRTIPGEFFPHLVKDFAGIKEFQVLQHARDRIELRAVLSPAWQRSDEAELITQVASVVGEDTRFVFSPTDAIRLTQSGKRRVVVNLVDQHSAT